MKVYENWTRPKKRFKGETFGPTEVQPGGALTLRQQIERQKAAGVLNRLNLEQLYPNDGSEPVTDMPINIYADEFELRMQAKMVLNLGMEYKEAQVKAAAEVERLRAEAEAQPEAPPEPAA